MTEEEREFVRNAPEVIGEAAHGTELALKQINLGFSRFALAMHDARREYERNIARLSRARL